MKEKDLANKLWVDLIDTVTPIETRKDFVTYFKTLTDWYNKNRKYFNDEVIKKSNIDVYLNLDPYKYVVNNGELYLESDLLSSRDLNPSSLFSVSSFLKSHLMDLTSIVIGTCPSCEGYYLRYVIYKTLKEEEEKLVKACSWCNFAENLDGSNWDNSVGLVIEIPANKEDLIKYGVDISKPNIKKQFIN